MGHIVWAISYTVWLIMGVEIKLILLSPFHWSWQWIRFIDTDGKTKIKWCFSRFKSGIKCISVETGAALGPRVQQCEPLSICEYHVKVSSKKTKNLKMMKNLKNFGKQLIQFLLSPQFAIVFIFIIACFCILILPNKNHSWDFI